MRDDVRPGFRWPDEPPIYDGEAPYESLYRQRHEDVYGDEVDVVTPIEGPREWTLIAVDIAIGAVLVIAGVVIGAVFL